MSDAKLYAYTAIIIFAIVYLLFMCVRHNKKTVTAAGNNLIMVDVNGNVVRMSSVFVANELEEIKKDIARHSHHNLEFQEIMKNPNCRCTSHNMENMKMQCNKISKVLDKFISANTVFTPYTNADLIDGTKAGELETNIAAAHGANVYLDGNLANVPLRELDGANESDQTEYGESREGFSGTHVEGTHVEGTHVEGTFYEKLDAAIRILRTEKCTGKVDLNNLYSLQNQLRAKLKCYKKKCKCGAARDSEWADANKFNKFAELRNADMVRGQILPQDSYAYGSDQNPFGMTQLRPGGNMIDTFATTFNYQLSTELNAVPYKDPPEDVDGRLMRQSAGAVESFSAGPRADSENIDREIFFERTNPAIAAQEANIKNKDLYPMDLSVEMGLGDTWDKFIRANPQGWFHRRDIEPQDMLGYRLAGSFQKSLYNYADSYTNKVNRCLQDKYKNLEDKNIFDECMGWT